MKIERKWALFEEADCVIIVPETDSKPHGFRKGNEKEVELAGLDCPCKPKIMTGERGQIYGKAIIVHNSFEDAEFLDNVMRNF